MSLPLQVSDVRIGYGRRVVAESVSFDLHPGESLALLGPNGGGKSTLLKTLAGLVPKLGGSIRVNGNALETMQAKQIARNIGFVPQEEAWQFDFSVEDVVAMGRLPVSNGLFDTSEDHAAAADAMRRAGCLELRDRAVTELSGGERQRVLIARALAQETPIVFLDEPTSHLDPQYQVGTATLLRSLASEGKSLVLAIHDLTMAASMSDRAMIVANGRAGQPRETKQLLVSEELEEAYRTRFRRIESQEGLVVVPAGPC
jgi:iron complex transport system ATP-binding protein